jgi:hypothetical protein
MRRHGDERRAFSPLEDSIGWVTFNDVDLHLNSLWNEGSSPPQSDLGFPRALV